MGIDTSRLVHERNIMAARKIEVRVAALEDSIQRCFEMINEVMDKMDEIEDKANEARIDQIIDENIETSDDIIKNEIDDVPIDMMDREQLKIKADKMELEYMFNVPTEKLRSLIRENEIKENNDGVENTTEA